MISATFTKDDVTFTATGDGRRVRIMPPMCIPPGTYHNIDDIIRALTERPNLHQVG